MSGDMVGYTHSGARVEGQVTIPSEPKDVLMLFAIVWLSQVVGFWEGVSLEPPLSVVTAAEVGVGSDHRSVKVI
jgi:hypothetical protein